MQPYKAESKKLEELLESLFEEKEDSVPGDVEIWIPPVDTEDDPSHYVFCCDFNYLQYNA